VTCLLLAHLDELFLDPPVFANRVDRKPLHEIRAALTEFCLDDPTLEVLSAEPPRADPDPYPPRAAISETTTQSIFKNGVLLS